MLSQLSSATGSAHTPGRSLDADWVFQSELVLPLAHVRVEAGVLSDAGEMPWLACSLVGTGGGPDSAQPLGPRVKPKTLGSPSHTLYRGTGAPSRRCHAE